MALGGVAVHNLVIKDDVRYNALPKWVRAKKFELISYLREMDVSDRLALVATTTPTWTLAFLIETDKQEFGLYTANNLVFEQRLYKAAKAKKVNTQQLIDELAARNKEINRDTSEDKSQQYISCSEQLFLSQ